MEANSLSLCFTEQVSVQTTVPNLPFFLSPHNVHELFRAFQRIFTFLAGKRAFSLEALTSSFCLVLLIADWGEHSALSIPPS